MADLHPDVVRAISQLSGTRLGRRYNRFAKRRYGVSGPKLAGKTVSAEFGGRSTKTGRGVVSSAGARGPAQFIPSTRQAYIDKYGVDPWAGDKQAIKGLMLHQLSTGVEGYNPGMPTYKNLVLGQKLNAEDRRALKGAAGGKGSLTLEGAKSTDVALQSRTIPGQSFAKERRQARRELLLGGNLSLENLLEYKSSINSMQDVPERTVRDLKVKRRKGADITVPTRGGGGRTSVAKGGSIIGTPFKGTHTLGNWQSDNAIDVALPVGTKLRVPEDAVVEKVAGSYKGGADRFDGFQVTVRLKDGNRLFYTHLKGARVKAGQRLRAGQAIGRSGAANGVEHLHLGAERGNPKRYYR